MTPQSIAGMAADAIEKHTQGTEPELVSRFREYSQSDSPLLRIHLHGSLRTAAEVLGDRNKQLGRDLNQMLGWLDAYKA